MEKMNVLKTLRLLVAVGVFMIGKRRRELSLPFWKLVWRDTDVEEKTRKKEKEKKEVPFVERLT